jgi:hypothetical protein
VRKQPSTIKPIIAANMSQSTAFTGMPFLHWLPLAY